MTIRATHDPSLGFAPGDHVCVFYSGSRNLLDDIVVDYLTTGLEAGDQCFCTVDRPAAVRDRIAPGLIARDGMLRVLTEVEAYLPGGRFSREAFVGEMDALVRGAAEHGYGSLRAVGDESFLIRHGVDIDEWFAAEAQLNDVGGGAPDFFFCLYDLDLFDGPTTIPDYGGLRVVSDPTFDPPGPHGYLTKTEGPAVGRDQLGPVDLLLISHDNHPDNLDDGGRAGRS